MPAYRSLLSGPRWLLAAWLAVLLCATALFTNCASAAYTGSVVGISALQKASIIAAADDVTEEETKHVRVFDASNLPPGLSLSVGSDGKRAISVDAGRYEFASMLEANPLVSMFSPYEFYPYSETWRRIVCWSQVPLQWAALMMFWNLVPTSWVCWVAQGDNSPSYIRERQDNQLKVLKRMAVVVGADTIVYMGRDRGHAVRGGDPNVSNALTYFSGVAYAYDDKTRPNPTDAKYSKYRIRTPIPAPAN